MMPKRTLALLLLCARAALAADPTIVEAEPNDTPAEATPIAVPAILMGSMQGRDQDAYLWTVSDTDAQRRWTFELHGIPGRLTVVDILRVELAENGVDVAGFEKLLTVGSRDGLKPTLVEDLLFEPGDYILGFAHAGSGGDSGGVFRPPMTTLSFGEDGDETVPAAEEPGSYRMAIRQGRPPPAPRTDFAVGTSQAEAVAARPGGQYAGFGTASSSWHSLAFTAADAEQRWDIDVQVPVGRTLQAVLRDAAGGELARASADAHGRLAFTDLAPEAGTWLLELSGRADEGFMRTLRVESVGVRVEGEEAEPNNDWRRANRVDVGRPLSGRMNARSNDPDHFRFTLDEARTERRLRLTLEADPQHQFQLCLLHASGNVAQCRTRQGTVELAGLVLTPGDWGLRISGGPEDAAYTVTLADDGPIAPDFEAEPNDNVATASGTPATNRIRGRFDGQGDQDFYRLVVTEEAQLWRVQVVGDNVFELRYHNTSGRGVQGIRAQAGQNRVRLDNLYLLPGIHYVSVEGRGEGDYTLLARPIGPPDPDGELEPNDDTSRMQPLAIGQTRTGLLEDVGDVDYYRFSLDHWDHIRLTITPPADGSILPQLLWYGWQVRQERDLGVGAPMALSGLFPPGDYALRLQANRTSEAEYRIVLERLPRFGCAADCEPNDFTSFASPLPPTLVIEGRAWQDDDVYALPVFEADTEVTLRSDRRTPYVVDESTAGNLGNRSFVTRGAEGVYRGTIPAGRQTYLYVSADRGTPDYRLEIEFSGGPAPVVAADPPLTLALTLDAAEVAAYRSYGQRVRGRLELTNTGDDPATIQLDAATSNYRWRATLEQDRATIPAGGTLGVPVLLTVPNDAWADRPVRISVRARAADGGQVETYAEVAAGREAAPIEPVRHWALPEALLGGFNAALQPLGGRMLEQYDDGPGRGFGELFNGFAADEMSMLLRGGTPNPPITVELAGGPVEVAGVALNLFGGRAPRQWLRDVELALSMDGETFTPVLSERLLPIQTEQAFVLESPVTARFARLLLPTGFDGLPNEQLSLGEFKVIVKPGEDLSGGAGYNLADPALGGHVVSMTPDGTHRVRPAMLDADDRYTSLAVPAGGRAEWVVGFHHARAAQLTRIEWVAPSEDPRYRISSVTLSASLDSPVGPWLPLGEWTFDPDAELQTFEFEQPIWARYLKFTAPPGDQRRREDLPAALRIWERPTGGEYRSILAEWGNASQAAIYEALRDVELERPFVRAGNDSRARAAALELGELAGGQVQLGVHEHWYRLRVPDGQNVLKLIVGGDPTVRTVLAVENDAGEPVPVNKLGRESTPELHVYESLVASGGVYYVRVEEPPRNVAFLWDTSASVAPYIDMIYNAMAAYATDLVPGRDAANFVPFGDRPLLRDWYGHPYILQTVLNDYPRTADSSDAEGSLATAMRSLAPLAGTKAIVIVTDAAVGPNSTVWDEFARVQPRVFTLHVSSAGVMARDVPRETQLMQDWSRVNGGHYAYANGHGEMEVAFDRAATMLRRPADYTLRVEAEYREAPGPGLLLLTRREGDASGDGGVGDASAADDAVALILDASGSMLQRLDGTRRIAIARDVLTQAVTRDIAPGTPLSLRVFGHREPNACRSDLEIPLGPLDPAAASAVISGIDAMNLARTPIADSLALLESDLAGVTGRKVAVLVTDGEETCEGDPAAVIEQLQERGFEISVNIVGFAIDDVELEREFERWATLGGGRYFTATDRMGLSEAVAEALQTPFTVYDMSGNVAATGVVGGEPVELAPAFYRVVVSGSPARIFDRVEIAGERTVTLEAN